MRGEYGVVFATSRAADLSWWLCKLCKVINGFNVLFSNKLSRWGSANTMTSLLTVLTVLVQDGVI